MVRTKVWKSIFSRAVLFLHISPAAVAVAETRDVCVIGAGFSGLGAARGLFDKGGRTIVVLEARNRIGGRASTITVGGQTTDAGCMLMTGWNETNPLTCLAKHFDLVKIQYDSDWPFNKTAHALAYNAQTGESMAWQSVATLSTDFVNGKKLKVVKRLAGANANMIQGVEAYNKKFELRGRNADLMHWVSDQLFVETEYSGASQDMSFQWFWEDQDFEGKTYMIPAGYSQLITHLAQGLDVRLGNPVTAIDYSGTKVIITAKNGNFTCGKVVVTVPLGVLKSKAITFTPPLSTKKQTAIDKLGMGTLEKVFLTFSTKVFPTVRGVYFKKGIKTGTISSFHNVGNVYGGNMVVGYHGGSTSTKTLQKMTDAELVQATVDEITNITGKPCPPPLGSYVTRWQTDPYSQGSYSYIAVGSNPTMMTSIFNNIDDKVYFAGEHTQENHYGSAHGALLSGERAARAIDADVKFFYHSSCTRKTSNYEATEIRS